MTPSLACSANLTKKVDIREDKAGNIIPTSGFLSGAAVRCRTGDRKVAGSTPGRSAIKSTRSTQPSIPPG